MLSRIFTCLLSTFYFALFSDFAAANPHAFDLPISQILVSGNEKTQTRFILKWSGLNLGEFLTREDIKTARQNILDTSLFKRVEINTVEDSDQVKVKIDLEEKYYTLALPRWSRNSNGDIKSGVKLYMHNIDGADRTLNLLVEQTDISDGDNSERYRFDYRLPQYSKPYYYRWQLGESRKNTSESDFRNIEYRKNASFSVARDLNTRFFQLPITLNIDLNFEQVRLDQPYPMAFNEIEAGNFNRIGVLLEYNDVHQQRFRRFGRYISLSFQQGLEELESDYISHILEYEWKIYRPLNSRDNFNSRFFVGISEDSPFNSPYYELGGANNVRGLDRDIYAGDTLLFGNFEYVRGYSNYPSFRSSLFLDIGNVYPDTSSIDLNENYTTIGLGLRWKLTSFIKTDLFIDIAYDPDTEETRVYGGTSLNF